MFRGTLFIGNSPFLSGFGETVLATEDVNIGLAGNGLDVWSRLLVYSWEQ